jgi:hypothetical protein
LDVALSSDSVYWTTGTEIMRAPIDSGSTVAMAIGQKGASRLAIDTQSLYWANTDAILTIGLGGGAPKVLASGQDGPAGIAVDDTAVYWIAGGAPNPIDGGVTSTGGVFSVPKGGGAITTLVSGLGSAEAVAVAGDVVAFASAQKSESGSVIGTVPRLGAPWRELATSDRQVTSIAVDDTDVFWADGDSATVDVTNNDGRIRSAALASGKVSLLAGSQTGPDKVILLGSELFWSNSGGANNANSEGNASISSLSTAGGSVVPLVTGRQWIGSFAIDANRVAWVDEFDTFAGVGGIVVMPR